MGLYLIIASWVLYGQIPSFPLWFSIVNTVLGALEILGTFVKVINAK